jgi:hypothetical protein
MGTMDTKPTIKIELTPEQNRQAERPTDKDARTVKLTLQELDDRVAPAVVIA